MIKNMPQVPKISGAVCALPARTPMLGRCAAGGLWCLGPVALSALEAERGCREGVV